VGLITGLLGLPLAPVRGTIWVAEQLLQQAEDEYYDPQDGQLTEDEAAEWEDELLERLLIGQDRLGREHG
jgi:hypothetical protein